MSRIPLAEHETGRLPGRALLESLAALARAPVSLEDTLAKWLDMFELERRMVDLAHALSERYRVYLLSNIGDLHWAHLAREYRLHAHRPWRAAVVRRRHHEAARGHLRRGRAALRARAGCDGVHR